MSERRIEAGEAGERHCPEQGQGEGDASDDEEDSLPLSTFVEFAIPRDFLTEEPERQGQEGYGRYSWLIPTIQGKLRSMGGYPLLTQGELVPLGPEPKGVVPQVNSAVTQEEDAEDSMPLATLQELGKSAVPRNGTKCSAHEGAASGSGQ